LRPALVTRTRILGSWCPRVLLYLVGFPVFNGRRSDPFTRHCGARGGWYLCQIGTVGTELGVIRDETNSRHQSVP
jgi:hypothetical protein